VSPTFFATHTLPGRRPQPGPGTRRAQGWIFGTLALGVCNGLLVEGWGALARGPQALDAYLGIYRSAAGIGLALLLLVGCLVGLLNVIRIDGRGYRAGFGTRSRLGSGPRTGAGPRPGAGVDSPGPGAATGAGISSSLVYLVLAGAAAVLRVAATGSA